MCIFNSIRLGLPNLPVYAELQASHTAGDKRDRARQYGATTRGATHNSKTVRADIRYPREHSQSREGKAICG